MNQISINLLRASSGLSSEELIILNKLRLFSIILLCVTICLGMFVGVSYIAGRIQYNRLEEKRSNLSKMIAIQAKKEVLFLSIQERIPVIEKILKSQYQWDKVIADTMEMISPRSLRAISIENDSRIYAKAQVNSLEEVESIIFAMVKKVEEDKIRSLVLNSLILGRDGKIDLVFTFLPKL